MHESKICDLKAQHDQRLMLANKDIQLWKDRFRESEAEVRDLRLKIQDLVKDQQTSTNFKDLALQLESLKASSVQQKQLKDLEEARAKSDKYEKLYLQVKGQCQAFELQLKLFTASKIIKPDEDAGLKEEVKRLKKLLTQAKEKEQKLQENIKLNAKNQQIKEEEVQHLIEALKTQIKKLRVELEQTKVVNAKLKEDLS